MKNDLLIPWFQRANRSRRFLVGVSGGADSVAFLHLLVDVGFQNLVVCHLNHQLRGRSSAADARFVERLAAQFSLPCESGRGEVKRKMIEYGESMETAARNARHEFFAECARKYRCRRILLAHHADDQAETVLWNLMRGSHGMKGMKEEQIINVMGCEIQVIRPLLGLRRSELVEWLTSRKIRWREDSSNGEPVAIRNRIRNEVFPLLDAISGRDSAAAFIRGAVDTEAREKHETEKLSQVCVLDPQGRIHLPSLRKLTVEQQSMVLRNYLLEHEIGNIDHKLIDRSLNMLDISTSAVINLPGGSRLRRTAGRLWVDRG